MSYIPFYEQPFLLITLNSLIQQLSVSPFYFPIKWNFFPIFKQLSQSINVYFLSRDRIFVIFYIVQPALVFKILLLLLFVNFIDLFIEIQQDCLSPFVHSFPCIMSIPNDQYLFGHNVTVLRSFLSELSLSNLIDRIL